MITIVEKALEGKTPGFFILNQEDSKRVFEEVKKKCDNSALVEFDVHKWLVQLYMSATLEEFYTRTKVSTLSTDTQHDIVRLLITTLNQIIMNDKRRESMQDKKWTRRLSFNRVHNVKSLNNMLHDDNTKLFHVNVAKSDVKDVDSLMKKMFTDVKTMYIDNYSKFIIPPFKSVLPIFSNDVASFIGDNYDFADFFTLVFHSDLSCTLSFTQNMRCNSKEEELKNVERKSTDIKYNVNIFDTIDDIKDHISSKLSNKGDAIKQDIIQQDGTSYQIPTYLDIVYERNITSLLISIEQDLKDHKIDTIVFQHNDTYSEFTVHVLVLKH